jgi:RimJ/RimL family protein N-acetyltransferase
MSYCRHLNRQEGAFCSRHAAGLRHDAWVDVSIHLTTRAAARRVARARRDPDADLAWAEGYPMDGDRRACESYLSQLPVLGGGSRTSPFGYYQIILDREVVGGIGFHGPPRNGLVEVGYGVVPSVRERGVATTSLRLILDLASTLDGVTRVCGRTSPDNIASQKVMLGAGMAHVGSDPEFLHYETSLAGRVGNI